MRNIVNSLFSATTTATRASMAAGAAAVLIAGLAGCSDSDGNSATGSGSAASQSRSATAATTPPPQPVDRGTTVTAPPVPTTDPNGPVGGNPDPDDGSACDPDDAGTLIDAAIGQISPPLPDGRWVTEENNFSCSGFTYVTLATEMGTVSSPDQLLLFHDGEFLGTGTACNLGYQTVTGADDNEVYVTYRYLVGDEPNADPQGQVDVSYRWNGSEVEQVGELPTAVTQGRC